MTTKKLKNLVIEARKRHHYEFADALEQAITNNEEENKNLLEWLRDRLNQEIQIRSRN